MCINCKQQSNCTGLLASDLKYAKRQVEFGNLPRTPEYEQCYSYKETWDLLSPFSHLKEFMFYCKVYRYLLLGHQFSPVTERRMSPTKTWKLPLQRSWYSLKISCLSTKWLQPDLEKWHEYNLRFRCLLFLPFY